jgi:hypothetical protein
MTISEKAAYLKGLMAGMKMSESSDEGKLFAAIADLLEDISLAVSDLEDETAAMRDYIDELDTDLAEVETEVYGLDECDCECDCDCDCCCDDDDIVELECPACGEEICIEEEELEDCEQLECPACGKMLNVVCEECDEDEEDDE